LAFIGSAKAADRLISQHPHPHRLHRVLSLEGKDLAIVAHDADIGIAAVRLLHFKYNCLIRVLLPQQQVVKGALTFNGQRCTALKLIFVNEVISSSFLEQLNHKVSELKAGLPWTSGVSITPMPEDGKMDALLSLVEDALQKGAGLINAEANAGKVYGNIFLPAILAPINQEMRIWHQEQFGPVRLIIRLWSKT
jgi:glyceraldehyde-3-phosphate dehydrogenase (NADP+)